MKIAVVGKGGSGKTTTASVVARTLARDGHEVVALDCDANANMALSLGLGVETSEHLASMRERLDAGEEAHAEDMDALLAQYGAPGPEGLHFAVVNRIQSPNPGCPCCGLSPASMLAQLDAPSRVVIADMEAGVGTLTRLAIDAVDLALVVAEPTARSLDVAERAIAIARGKGIRRIILVANRLEGEGDVATFRARFPDIELAVVPDDRAIMEADRAGRSPCDQSPQAPAVVALVALGRHLGGLLTPV